MKTTQHILLCLLLWAFSAAHALAAHTDGETKFIKAGSDFSELDVSKIPSGQLWMPFFSSLDSLPNRKT